MFEKLRHAFGEALENFKHEMDRADVPGAVGKLLSGMKQEVTEAQARLMALEADLQKATAAIEREEQQLDTCRRREKMATRIDDTDTAGIAAEYAAKHEQRLDAFRLKKKAFEEELTFRRTEVAEMLVAIKKAQKEKDTLAAQAGRTGARDSISASEDLFSELDRMAAKIGDEDARNAADQEIDLSFGDLPDMDSIDDEPPPEPEMTVDEKLDALKRAMGKE